MAAPRSEVDALLEREARQVSAVRGGVVEFPRPSRHLNAVWRQKVVHWYFVVVAALRRQYAALEGADATNPFGRASVHVASSLLDNYLASLPTERALRYELDRPAYQLLATTCLLLGMRLARRDQIRQAREREAAADGNDGRQPGEGGARALKRSETRRTDMNEVSATSTEAAVTAAAIPDTATILRFSAAPESISEKNVVLMVREMMSSRSFPRSKVVTPLDFVQALGDARTRVSEDGSVSLGPTDAETASRLADVAVRNSSFAGCRPSVVACAMITLALARSTDVNLSMAALRQKVNHSIFGSEDDSSLQVSIRRAESNLLLASIQFRVPASLNRPLNRHLAPTTHLIPPEDE